jgi:hypothetical protein
MLIKNAKTIQRSEKNQLILLATVIMALPTDINTKK